MLSSRFLGVVIYNFDYIKATRKGEYSSADRPNRTGKSTSEQFTHILSLNLVYLSSNHDVSVKKILDDFADHVPLLDRDVLGCQCQTAEIKHGYNGYSEYR